MAVDCAMTTRPEACLGSAETQLVEAAVFKTKVMGDFAEQSFPYFPPQSFPVTAAELFQIAFKKNDSVG